MLYGQLFPTKMRYVRKYYEVDPENTIIADEIWDDVIREKDRLLDEVYNNYVNVWDVSFTAVCNECGTSFPGNVNKQFKYTLHCPNCNASNYKFETIEDVVDPEFKKRIYRYISNLRYIELKFSSPEEVVWPTFPTI